MEKIKDRILWVDIFKAITIVSVVIGHSTGLYNMYIYQFHMAAFFFISGFTTDLNKRSLSLTIWNKACTMLLPVITIFVFFLIFLAILSHFGLYQYFFNDPFIGLNSGLVQFFRGNNYIFWMGATWFIIVLFEVVVFQKIIHSFWGGKVNPGYIFTIVLTFLLGYYMVRSNVKLQLSIFTTDLLFIAQFYFGIGIILKKYDLLKIISESWLAVISLGVFSLILLYIFGNVIPATVDYPSRHFGNPIIDAVAAINGIIFIFVISSFLAKAPLIARSILTSIGKNTIGIVFFHFMFFNISFAILYFFGIMPITGLQHFLPPTEIGITYWWLFTFISIAFSILLWKALIYLKPLKLLLGDNKDAYLNAYVKLSRHQFFPKMNGLSFSITTLKSYTSSLISFLKKHYVSSILVTIIIILTVSPLLMQGIICNDELKSRFARIIGFNHLINWGITNELSQGRPLRILAAFNNAFGLLSTNIFISKSIQVCLILMSIALFGYLTFKLFGNKYFSLFLSLFILVLLPITFEHAVPNAFVSLTCLPMIFLLLSFIYYISYLEKPSLKSILLSMFLFSISLLGYEFIITFILVFPLLYFAKIPKGNYRIITFTKLTVIPIFLGFIYLGLLFISQKLFSNTYEGAQVGFVSISSSFEIIKNLFKSALPGYYIFNEKSQYLFYLYGNLQPSITNILNKINIESIIELLKSIFKRELNFRIVFLVLTIFIMFVRILDNKFRGSKISQTIPFYVIVITFFYSFIPSLPIAISKMYQGNVNESNFISLPVSFFLFFITCFFIVSIIWTIYERVQWKYTWLIITIILCFFILPVQIMNDTFSKEQRQNYSRLVLIENLIQTKAFQNMQKQTIFAPDLYLTKNLLAIHKGYWERFALTKGIKVGIVESDSYNNEDFIIYFQNDKYFVLQGGNEVVVLSNVKMSGNYPIKVGENKYLNANFEQPEFDGAFFRYSFIKTKLNQEVFLEKHNIFQEPFEDLCKTIGGTLAKANIISGLYNDGWLSESFKFEIQTGELGKLILNGYYPNEITGNETGVINIDGISNIFTLSENNFAITVNAPKQKVVSVNIKNNFSFNATSPDIRKLSFIILDIQGL